VDLSSKNCTIQFEIGHFFNANLVHGSFRRFSGRLVFDSDNAEASRIRWTVKAASLDTGNLERDKQVRHKNYLDVAKFPTISFQSSGARQTDPSHLTITGAFTLHGVTRILSLPVVLGEHGEYDCKFRIQRSDYGMPSGDVMAGNTVDIHLNVRAPRRA
jgi:polyisoprenoid-binding protein YceI